MHGDQENIGIIEPYWKCFGTKLYVNFTTVFENPVFQMGFVWDDLHRGKKN